MTDKNRVLELAGVQLNEDVQAQVDRLLGKLLVDVNKIHGELIKIKSSGGSLNGQLEDFMYGLPNQINKFRKDKA